jgi:protocadherin Fat 4
VTENAPRGTFVIQVTSVDKDVGENAKCIYGLVEDLNNQFKIDPASGNITVNGMLDRESQDEYLLRVIAIDGSWRAETLVSILIQDINVSRQRNNWSYWSSVFTSIFMIFRTIRQCMTTASTVSMYQKMINPFPLSDK